MQLDRIIQSQGFGSRKECRSLIRAERVAVAGDVCADPFADFVPQGLTFSVDGVPWSWREKAWLMLNKPLDVECSHQPKHHRSVYSLLPPPLVGRGVQSVGRLDADTTGLILFSDDGQFIHAVSSGRRKVPKTYRVTPKHAVDDGQVAQLLAGVVLHDSPEPARAVRVALETDGTVLLTVSEGRYHQVRRMLAAIGNRVEALQRIAVGGLVLPADLEIGSWRWLEAGDLDALWNFAEPASATAGG